MINFSSEKQIVKSRYLGPCSKPWAGGEGHGFSVRGPDLIHVWGWGRGVEVTHCVDCLLLQKTRHWAEP